MASDVPPTIRIRGSISPSSLSLSHLASQPVHLHLTVHVLNSDAPMTFRADFSALSLNQAFIGTAWILQDALTGDVLVPSTVHGLLAPSTTINLDEDDIVTLYPDQPFQRSIVLGPLPIKLSSKDSDGEDFRTSHHICGIRLSRFEAGQKYKVIPRKKPFSMHWYAKGDAKELEKRHGGKRVFSVEQITSHDRTPEVELDGEAPSIEIVA